MDAQRIGPAFIAVAARHRAEGNIPMIPNERVSLDEAPTLVRWILSIKPS